MEALACLNSNVDGVGGRRKLTLLEVLDVAASQGDTNAVNLGSGGGPAGSG